MLTLIWGNDGWCYIPELHIRRKFTEVGSHEENWNGVIAIPEHIEQITSSSYETTFPQKTSNQDIRKKSRSRQVKSQ